MEKLNSTAKELEKIANDLNNAVDDDMGELLSTTEQLRSLVTMMKGYVNNLDLSEEHNILSDGCCGTLAVISVMYDKISVAYDKMSDIHKRISAII